MQIKSGHKMSKVKVFLLFQVHKQQAYKVHKRE